MNGIFFFFRIRINSVLDNKEVLTSDVQGGQPDGETGETEIPSAIDDTTLVEEFPDQVLMAEVENINHLPFETTEEVKVSLCASHFGVSITFISIIFQCQSIPLKMCVKTDWDIPVNINARIITSDARFVCKGKYQCSSKFKLFLDSCT